MTPTSRNALSAVLAALVVATAATATRAATAPATPSALTAPPGPVALATPTVPPAAYPAPGRITGDTGAHDPVMIRRPEGGYLLAMTGNGVSLKTSTDRVAIRNAGSAFPNGTPWANTYTGGGRNLWAPDLSYRNGRYYMYYSASTFGSQRSAIFLATSTTGAAGSWVNEGLVIESSGANDYNAIDPNLFVDGQGRWWLTFGSFWTGIKLISLNPATGRRSTTDTAVRPLASRSGSTAIEAPFIVQKNGYFYLFVSFDLCCRGAQSTYRIMVGRSTSVTGPYVDRAGTPMTSGGGTQVLARHTTVIGPGHQAVLSDTDSDVLIYHYYLSNGQSRLGINLLAYDTAGWPFVY